MKLDDIIAKVATDTGLRRADVKGAVEGTFAAIKSAVDAGDKISIPGMGSFQLREREAGQRVIKTGETREVTAARYMTFKPSRVAMGHPPKKGARGDKGAAAPSS